MIRSVVAISAAVALGCRAQTAPIPFGCGRAPAGAVAMSSEHYDQLVGDFHLIQVTTNQHDQEASHVREIHLFANDSAHRYRYVTPQVGRVRGERPVAGWVLLSPDVPWIPHTVYSQDLERPGIQWAGGRLRVGDVDVMDGVGDDLEVRDVSADGFWGSWSRNHGLELLMDSTGHEVPPEEGYFCALRISDAALQGTGGKSS